MSLEDRIGGDNANCADNTGLPEGYKMRDVVLPRSTSSGRYTGTLQPQNLLPPAQHTFLQRLEQFEAPYLEEKLLAENKFHSSEEFDRAFVEFKKYVGLVHISGEKLAMMSEKVDDVWHQFILFTKQYHDFCDKFLGEYLHHVPKTSYTPLDKQHKRNLTQFYKQIFGQPSPLWDIKADCSSCNNGCTSSGMCSGGDD